MNILIVSLHFVEYAVELANALAVKNKVHLVLSARRVDETLGDEFNEKLENNVSYTLLPNSRLWSISILKVIYSISKVLIEHRFDIMHLQECGNPLNLLFVLFSPKPVVATVHDVRIHPGKQSSSVKPWQLWLLGKIRKHGYTRIIVHGEYLKRQFIDNYKRPAQDIFVVPHGPLFSFLPDNNKTAEEPHTVLFFGRIQEYKGLKYLIEAEPMVSSVLHDFKIIIAGKGSDLETYKASLVSNPHFEIHDRFIQNNEVAPFFQRVSAVVLPYVEASQSGIAAMAFAFAKPVITTDVGSLAEMVEHDITGAIVPARDPGALSEAIISLLAEPSKREMLSQNIRKAAQTEFGWKHIAMLTDKVYQTIGDD